VSQDISRHESHDTPEDCGSGDEDDDALDAEG
jgi:hypothetical protein